MKKFGILVLLFLWIYNTRAQQLPTALEQQLENLSEATEEDLEDDSYLQQLQYNALHPLNLNTATATDLQTLRLLTPLQIAHFIQYRKLFQNLISLYELQAVPLWDVATIRRVLPYLTITATLEHPPGPKIFHNLCGGIRRAGCGRAAGTRTTTGPQCARDART